ncbi:MAG: TM0996/MTH895 family glutaredoxin-like protein [Pseudomonadales bacterium]|nr:TM0996/MTH895 family glutaredoxin-like protein [Halioglobus sp.]MCP5194591.1 TM0996/MTH895 family glutaredoxin-like protein [Pseudomonadales bacterium]
MKFTIYGSGCAKCQKLTANAEAAALALGLDYDIEKVTDVNGIVDAGVMHTPALAVNGEVVVEGKIPGPDEIKRLLA